VPGRAGVLDADAITRAAEIIENECQTFTDPSCGQTQVSAGYFCACGFTKPVLLFLDYLGHFHCKKAREADWQQYNLI